MDSACAGCKQHSTLLTRSSSCHYCRRPFRSGPPSHRHHCQHRRSCTKAAAKARDQQKGNNKASRTSQAGSDANTRKAEAANLTDYLHFGRLIGQRPADVEATLNSKAMQFERNADAEDYLERWQADEAPTYAMMDALMQGSGPSSGSSKSSKLQKAKNRVVAPSDEFAQFAQEAVANAKKAKRMAGQGSRSLLKAKPTGSAATLTRPPRLPSGSEGASLARPARRDEPALLSRPKPTVTDEMRWSDDSAGSTPQPRTDPSTPDLPPPALTYEDFDILIGNMSKRKPKAKKLSPKGEGPALKPAQKPSQRLADSSNTPPMPALRPPSGSSSFSPTGAQPSSPSPPTASKRSRPSLPVADSLPEVSLLAPPGGFVDKRVSKVKTPARKPSEEKATPSLTARPTAPPPPLVHGTGEELQKVADTRTMRNSKKAAEPATDGVMGSSVSRAADSMPHGSTDDLAASPAISPGLTSPKPLAQRPQHSSTSPEMTAGTSAQRLPTSKRAKAKLLASVNSLTTPLPARAPAAAEPSTSAAAPVSPPLEEGVKSTGSQAAPLADPQAAPQADPQAAPRTAPLNQKPQRDSSLSGPAAGNNAELPSKAQSAEAEVTPKRLSLSKAGLASKRPLNSTNDAPPGQLFVVEQPSSTDLVSPAQADTDSKLVKPHPKNRISDPLDESAWRPDANTAARQSADSAVELQAVQLESPPDRLGGAVEPSLPSSPRQPKRPTPVLAERPARPLVLPADLQHRPPKKWDQFNTLESPVNTLEESLQFAQRLKDEQRQLPVVIVAANAGGVLVTNRMLKAFMPLVEMTSVMGFQVLSVDAELRKAAGVEGHIDDATAASIRRKAMRTLRGRTTTARVIAVGGPNLGNLGIIMSCKQVGYTTKTAREEQHVYQHLPREHIDILQQNIGTNIQGTVVGVRPYGCFVAFDVEAVPASEGGSGPGVASGPQAGLTLEVYGMVHLSEIAWDFVKDARLAVKQGDLIEAKLTSVDPSTCKVWLSMRQVHPDPLQETLDSLLAEDLAALDDSDSTTHASHAGSGVMGSELDFPEAAEVARSLALLLDVDSVQPGPRSKTESSAPTLQVYLAKPMLQEEEATALAAVSGSEDPDEAAAESGTEGYDSENNDYSDDSNADEAELSVPLAAIDVDSKDDDTSQASKDPSIQSVADANDNRWYAPPASSSKAADAVLKHDTGSNGADDSHISQSTPSSSVTLSDATSVNELSLQDGSAESARADASSSLDSSNHEGSNGDDVENVSASFDWVDDCDSTVCTLVVQKGQQQQELLVSGGITRQQLTDEVNEIVSTLTAT